MPVWTRIRAPAPAEAALSVLNLDLADEAALIAAARVDPRAFAPLYRAYVDAIYRYCYRRLGDREAAEDATSIVFTNALAALPRFREGRAFRPWLFAIAHNVICDDVRARRPSVPVEPSMDLIDEGPSPEDVAFAAESRETVRDLLARLTDGQRRVVELRLAGLTGPEIATVTGKSLPAVKFAQFAAYTRLRQLLGVATSGEEAGHGDR